MIPDLETASRAAMVLLLDIADYPSGEKPDVIPGEVRFYARRRAAALGAALAAPVACKVPSFLTDFARYRTDRPFDVGLETTPWPKTEDGLYDMSLGTMLRFTRLQALEEAVQEAERMSRLFDCDPRTTAVWMGRRIVDAIRALANKEPSDGHME